LLYLSREAAPQKYLKRILATDITDKHKIRNNDEKLFFNQKYLSSSVQICG
jgi:hypothetical protein